MGASVDACGLPLPPHVVLPQRTLGGPRVVTHHCPTKERLEGAATHGPEVAELAFSIALAFDTSAVENPQMARPIRPPTAAFWLVSQAAMKS